MARKFKYVPLSAIKSTMGASPFYDGAQILLNVKNVRGYAPTDNEQKQGYCLIPFDGNEKQDFWLITLKRSLGTKINVLATTDSELAKNRQFAADAPTGCSGIDEFNAFLKVWEIDNNTEKVLIEVSRITAENDAEYLTISVVKQFPAADAPATDAAATDASADADNLEDWQNPAIPYSDLSREQKIRRTNWNKTHDKVRTDDPEPRA